MILEIYYCSLCSCQTTHEYKQSSEDRQRQLWKCTICNSYIDITIANFTTASKLIIVRYTHRSLQTPHHVV